MNITLKRTEEQVELIKAMASKNRNVAYEAQAAAAEFVGPVLSEVMNNAPTLSNMFTSFQFNVIFFSRSCIQFLGSRCGLAYIFCRN